MVLEFDHIAEKLFDVGQALRYRRWQSILDEIAKCEVAAQTAIGGVPLLAEARCAQSSNRAWRSRSKRAAGLEPAPRPWKGLVQPLHHARAGLILAASPGPGQGSVP